MSPPIGTWLEHLRGWLNVAFYTLLVIALGCFSAPSFFGEVSRADFHQAAWTLLGVALLLIGLMKLVELRVQKKSGREKRT